jgi:Zn-dependent protease with chaperone function
MQLHKSCGKALIVLLALTMTAVQPLALPAQNTPQMPDPGRVSMNRQQQEQLGLQAAGEVYKQMPVLPDSSPVTQYVRQLGQRLQAVIPSERSWPYQFHVVPQKEINAFALPGGPIFINLGTIQAAENEAQLAGVMSHEMSHVYMQHSAKQIAKSQWTGLLAGIAGAIMPQSGLGDLARMGIQVGAGTVMMKYSRTDEAQADSVGAIIMYNAGYNPRALADFFTTLEKKYGKGGPQFLSDHPNPGNREEAITKEIQPWPQKQYRDSSDAFARARKTALGSRTYSAQEIAQGAKQGIWARQNARGGALPPGVVSSGTGAAGVVDVSLEQVRPSQNFRQAEQRTFTISHPENWQATGSNNSFLIAPPAGVSQAGVAYGVVIDLAPSAGGSLDEATQAVLDSLLKENPGMSVSSDVRNVQVGGVEARSVYLSGSSPVQRNGQPLPERDWLVTLPRRDGGLLYLVFVAPEQDFSELHPVYLKMLESLRLK